MNDTFSTVQETSDGGFIAAGSASSFSGPISLIKLDSEGNELSTYERERLRKIRRNKRRLDDLGLITKPETPLPKKRKQSRVTKQLKIIPSRSSTRIKVSQIHQYAPPIYNYSSLLSISRIPRRHRMR